LILGYTFGEREGESMGRLYGRCDESFDRLEQKIKSMKGGE